MSSDYTTVYPARLKQMSEAWTQPTIPHNPPYFGLALFEPSGEKKDQALLYFGLALFEPSGEKKDQGLLSIGLMARRVAEMHWPQEAKTDVMSYYYLEPTGQTISGFSGSASTMGVISPSPSNTIGVLSPYDPFAIFGPWLAVAHRYDPTALARVKLGKFNQTHMVAAALRILDNLRKALVMAGTTQLPPIHAFTPEDGSLLIEWTATHWRIGFSVEQDTKDAGWYLVSDELAGNIRAYGNLAGVDVPWLVKWALAHLE